jgi:hypothetical protein
MTTFCSDILDAIVQSMLDHTDIMLKFKISGDNSYYFRDIAGQK